MTKQEIIESAKRLPREQQVDLAMEFWDLVEIQDNDLPLTDDQRAELDRRIEDYVREPRGGRPWKDVKQDILRELDGKS